MKTFDTIVIGNGLMGSAAARYLSDWQQNVAVVGPGEPTNPQNHQGVFSSHYDEGRLTRQLSQDPVWSEVARLAVANYSTLEQRSGVSFHGAVGRVHATRYTQKEEADLLAFMAKGTAEYGIQYRYFSADDDSWQEMFPFLSFPKGYGLFYEPGPAGYVNPRAMLKAQNVIAQQNGAHFIDDYAVNVESTAVSVTVTTASGQKLSANKALIACGAFTNFNSLLTQPIPLRLKTEAMVWGEVSEETAVSLKEMPGVGYNIDDPDIDDIYMAPPLLYPDGTYKIKMGCNSKGELWPETLEEVQAWFQDGPSEDDLPSMSNALQSVLPEVNFQKLTSHRCIVTYTPSGYPTIDQLPTDENGRLFVATGGNGTGAQGSDTLGRLAAGLMHDGRWIDTIPRQVFLASNNWGESDKKLTKAQARAMQKEGGC
ncbi:MAG: FAD-dependent oxidoreductase [Chloroflexota bacterium]